MMRRPFAKLALGLGTLAALGWTALMPGQAGAQDITSGLAAHWTFDQGSGTSATDSAGGNPGTLTNMDPGTAWVDGKSGKALDFDGVDDFVEYPANIEFNDGDFTVAGWFRREGPAGGLEDNFAIFSQRVEAAGNGNPAVVLFGRASAGMAGAQIRDNAGALIQTFGTTALNDNEWYHVAAVKTATALRIYVNGVMENSVSHTLTGDFDVGATNRLIGKNRWGGVDQSFSNGSIDDVRVYTRALSDEDITALYEDSASAGLPCDNDHEAVLIFNPAIKAMQYCDGTNWYAIARTRVADSSGSSDDGGGPDTTPDTFSFTDQTDVALNTQITSNSITIAGIDTAANVSVSGDGSPEIRIDGGPWVTSGTITNGQTLEVRLTSANANSTTRTATVTVGSISDTWSVMTESTSADTTPDAFNFTDVTNQALDTQITSNSITIAGIDAAANVTVSGDGSPQVRINGGGWVTSGTITNGQTLEVRLTSSASASTAATATITVGSVSDTWSVTTISTGCDAGGVLVDGYCWRASASGQTCDAACTSYGGCNLAATREHVGSGGTDANCLAVLTALGIGSGSVTAQGGASINLGCYSSGGRYRHTGTPMTGCNSATSPGSRACACNNGSITFDITPDTFTFTNVTSATPSTQYTSNSVTISGINMPVSVAATAGAEFSINGGAYGTTGKISNGQTLTIRATSLAGGASIKTINVTVGATIRTWVITNAGPASCGGVMVGGHCWLASEVNETCNSACTPYGGCNLAGTKDYAGSEGTDANCLAVLTALNLGSGSVTTHVSAIGCGVSGSARRRGTTSTVCNIANSSTRQACACNNVDVDTTPDAFSFTDQTDVAVNTQITSNSITISGINTSTPVSVSGGGSPQISINGGTWSTSGNITNGQTLAVRLTSSGTASTTLTATVTVGGVSDSWSVTTEAASGPTGCPNIGDVCLDGSINAGSGLYVPDVDQSVGTVWTYESQGNPGSQSLTDGKANQAWIVANRTLSDYQAIGFCENLIRHGHSDWYLPAKDELNVLYMNKDAIGGLVGNDWYWSSSADNATSYKYWGQYFPTGTQGLYNWTSHVGVRCVRKP